MGPSSPSNSKLNIAMKYLLAALLGLATVSVASCKSTTADMRAAEVLIDVTGMT